LHRRRQNGDVAHDRERGKPLRGPLRRVVDREGQRRSSADAVMTAAVAVGPEVEGVLRLTNALVLVLALASVPDPEVTCQFAVCCESGWPFAVRTMTKG
jgi:hypothetical protein